MANGLRLDRFFTKRKASASTAVTEPSSPVKPLPEIEQQFPSPSFIRPKTSRMAAREEPGIKPMSTGLASSGSFPVLRRSNSSIARLPSYGELPMFSQTFLSQEYADHSGSLLLQLSDFTFPKPPSSCGGDSAHSSTFAKGSPSRLHKSRTQLKINIPPKPIGPDTPPPSDQEDNSASPVERKLETANRKALRAPPTPESPIFALGSTKCTGKGSPAIDVVDKALYRDIRRKLGQPASPNSPLKSPSSDSALNSPRDLVFNQKPSHYEPGVDEFLHLADDDLNEPVEECLLESTPDRPPTPRSATSSFSTLTSSHDLPLMTLEPPCVSRPAEAAAFEAARIASRYSFDFVYVVNLWPDVYGPRENPNASPGLKGRLLAAYGLHNVKPPFQVSSLVQTKILRAVGWMEYRGQEGRLDEFSRGYAHAFYTGQFGRNEQGHRRDSAIDGVSLAPPKADRGVIFAAYRKPNEDGSVRGSDEAELTLLHADAEALVEMLIDIHAANRKRNYGVPIRFNDETGPLPHNTHSA